MELVRTFHPVGHGAFYTEQFYENGQCVFNVVYDCGGSPVGGLKKYVENYVRDTTNLNQYGRINILFVSHFHNDHIKGIPYLLNYCDKIAFPVLTPNVMLEAVVHNAVTQHEDNNSDEDVNNLLYDIYTREGYYDNKKMMFIEEAAEERHLKEDILREIEYVGGNVRNGTMFFSNMVPNWIFYPYNLKKGDIEQTIKNYFKTEGVIKYDDTIDIQKLKDVIKNKLQEVKKVYKEVKGEKTNYHSMTVYSGHKNCPKAFYCQCCCHCKTANCDTCYNLDANPHCLFTGDFPANSINVNSLITHYKEYWRCIGSLQVPHHGSSNIDGTYGTDLFYHCKLGVISTKFGKHSGIPSSFVIIELINQNTIPKYVTDDVRTKLVKFYNI